MQQYGFFLQSAVMSEEVLLSHRLLFGHPCIILCKIKLNKCRMEHSLFVLLIFYFCALSQGKQKKKNKQTNKEYSVLVVEMSPNDNG